MSYTDTGAVLIDFWSPQCRPCVALSPTIDEIDEEQAEVEVIKINVLENMDEAIKYQVRSLPTLVFIKDGEVIDTLVGSHTKSEIEEKLESIK